VSFLRPAALGLVFAVAASGCDVLPRPGDTFGLQSDARWVHHARLVAVRDSDVTLVRLRLDTAVTGGSDVLLTRFDFNPTPGYGDEYSLTLGIPLDSAAVRTKAKFALGPRPPAVPAVGTVACLCRPLQPDSVVGTFTIAQRAMVQLTGRIDATLYFTAWDDSTKHARYRLRQTIYGVKS
jgi:hypothetical protein